MFILFPIYITSSGVMLAYLAVSKLPVPFSQHLRRLCFTLSKRNETDGQNLSHFVVIETDKTKLLKWRYNRERYNYNTDS